MERLPKEAFVAALPALQLMLQEKFKHLPIRTRITNGGGVNPRNPFAPRLSSAYPFRVRVDLGEGYMSCTPNYLFGRHGIILTIMKTASGWSRKDVGAIISEWLQSVHFKQVKANARQRLAPLKEELMAAAWHPRRVARLLELGGWEALE